MVTFEVFTKPGCPACDATVRKLEALGAEFETTNAVAHIEELQARGFSSAPVVAVFDPDEEGILDQWCGYRPDRLNAYVGRRAFV